MFDLMVVLVCVLLVFGGLAYARLWLTEVGDLMWMAGLRPLIVIGSLVLTGLIVNLMSLWILPSSGMTATRFALALLAAPIPARRLADWIVWMRIPKGGREAFEAGVVFDQASAQQQSEFIRSLGEAEAAAPSEP
jgi:hypothetical protein